MVIAGSDANTNTKEVSDMFFSPMESIAYSQTHAEEAPKVSPSKNLAKSRQRHHVVDATGRAISWRWCQR